MWSRCWGRARPKVWSATTRSRRAWNRVRSLPSGESLGCYTVFVPLAISYLFFTLFAIFYLFVRPLLFKIPLCRQWGHNNTSSLGLQLHASPTVYDTKEQKHLPLHYCHLQMVRNIRCKDNKNSSYTLHNMSDVSHRRWRHSVFQAHQAPFRKKTPVYQTFFWHFLVILRVFSLYLHSILHSFCQNSVLTPLKMRP